MTRKSSLSAEQFNPDPAYMSELVKQCKDRHSLTLPALAKRIGVGVTSLKDWRIGKAKYQYAHQFILERLAAE